MFLFAVGAGPAAGVGAGADVFSLVVGGLNLASGASAGAGDGGGALAMVGGVAAGCMGGAAALGVGCARRFLGLRGALRLAVAVAL